MENKLLSKIISSNITNWTDKYFHQSAFDVPLKFPTKKVLDFLTKLKKKGILSSIGV